MERWLDRLEADETYGQLLDIERPACGACHGRIVVRPLDGVSR